MTTLLSSGATYDAVDFADADLARQSADGSRFLECTFVNCNLDDVVLDNCRLVDCVLESVNATTLNARSSVWRDTRIVGGRVGALVAHGAKLTRVTVVGCKVDYLNLRGCELLELSLVDCTVGELDLASTKADATKFAGTSIETLRLADNAFESVDLSRAALSRIEGIAGLSGVTVSAVQLHELAPSLAEHLGINVTTLG